MHRKISQGMNEIAAKSVETYHVHRDNRNVNISLLRL